MLNTMINLEKLETTKYLERCKEKRKYYIRKQASHSRDKLIYVDESGINKFLYREYSWAKRGKMVIGEIAGKRYMGESFILD